jgi:hypothetical protein
MAKQKKPKKPKRDETREARISLEIVGMAPESECEREMFVETPWEHKRTLAVPLSQLTVVHGNEETQQAVADRHYWVEMGYEF